MEVDVTGFESQAALNKFIADAKGVIAAQPDLLARLAKAEQLVPQLKEQLASVQREVDDHRKAQLRGNTPDNDPVRKYLMPTASRDELRQRGGVVQVDAAPEERRGQGVSEKQRWAASKGGAVRMIGGVERGTFVHGLLDDPRPASDWHRELQTRAENCRWIEVVAPNSPRLAEHRAGLVDHLRAGPAAIAKVFDDNAGQGGEWIITLPMMSLERTVELPRMVEGMIADMPVSSSAVTLPFLSTGVRPFLRGVGTSGDLNPAQLSKSVPTTADRTLTVKTLAVSIPVDLDGAEDSIVDTGPLMSMLAGEGLRDGKEDAIFNGDTAGTHQDTIASWNIRSRWGSTGLGGSDDHRRAWIGFRARAHDVSSSSDGSAAQTIAGYIAALATLTAPHGIDDVAYFTSPEHYLAKIVVDTNFLTVDKYGAGASILTGGIRPGEVGRIGGRRLVLSEFMSSDTNASGIFDNATTTYTGMVLANLNRFRMARRRSLRVNVEVVYRDNTAYVVATERCGLVTLDSSSVKNVAYLYKLAKS